MAHLPPLAPAMNEYLDFSITFHPARDGEFPVGVRGPAGEVTSCFQLPLGDAENLAERVHELQRVVRGGTTRGMSFGAAQRQGLKPQHVGQLLYTSIFHGPVLALFEQSLAMVNQREAGLRIKLRIDPTEPTLVAVNGLPWELMRRPQTDECLGLSNRNPLVRYLDVQRPCPAIPFTPPFRILVVISSLRGVAQLDLERECQLIRQSWGQRSDVQVDFLERATKPELQRQLGQADYHALHFMGHGEFETRSGRGVLVLESADGSPDYISGHELGVLLADEPTLRLVFLNACNTAQSSRDSEQNPFAGVASALVLAGVPVVVAMQYPISDEAAIVFAGKFYKLLPECYPLDYVVAEARKAIYLEGRDDSTEWATPAVFMRSADGMIFKSVYGRQPLVDEERTEFARLTTKVNRIWIEGKLDVDVPIKPPMELNKELVPKAVQTRFGGSPGSRLVPAGKTIAAVFDENERSLLILGDPGFGKTTSLLALAQYLIRRHNQDQTQPIPVVLYLSSWARSRLSIEDWAAREVLEKYKISDRMFRQWLTSGRIVLMLDGLNEVPETQRPACIEAVNNFLKQQISRTEFGGAAVCCRYDEYRQIPNRLDLQGAIRLQPLTEPQIREYLNKFGPVMHQLQAFLDEHPRLLEDARTPLMLGMMSVAYRLDPSRFSDVASATAREPAGPPDARQQILVDAYINRVFDGAGPPPAPYSRGTVNAGLVWLARRLKTHHQSILMIESIQPDWLRNRWEQVLNAAVYALALGSVVATIMLIIWQTSNIVDPALPASMDAHRFWFLISPIWAFLATGVEWIQFVRNKVRAASSPSRRSVGLASWLVVRVMVRTLVFYLIWVGLWYGASLAVQGTAWDWGWLAHPVQGGLSVSLLYAARTVTRNDDHFVGSTEVLTWSWVRAARGLLFGLLVGVLLWTVYWLVQRGSFSLTVLSRNLLFYPPLGAVVGLIFGGLTMGLVKSKTRPNEGVVLSLRNSLFAMLTAGAVVGLALVPILTGVFFEPDNNLIDNLIDKLVPSGMLACGAALAMFLWFGGIDVMRHYSLRLTLLVTGNMPWRLPRFLDYLSARELLQKIGGGYMFRNNLLLDYFARQPERSIWSGDEVVDREAQAGD